MKTSEKYFSFVLISWLIFGLYAGLQILESYGESIGPFMVGYMVAWVTVIFLGRFAIEWLINTIRKKDQ